MLKVKVNVMVSGGDDGSADILMEVRGRSQAVSRHGRDTAEVQECIKSL